MKINNFENISIICSKSLKEKICLLINILYLDGIKENKNIYMQTFLLKPTYYVNQLISYMTNVEFKIVESYMKPFSIKSNKLKQININKEDLVMALEKIRKANIVISSNKVFKEKDWLDYIFDLDNKYQIIIVDNFEELVNKSRKSFKKIKKKIEEYSEKYNAKIILFIDEKELIKYQFFDWKVSYVDKPFKFKYDKCNHLIDIVEEF